MATTTARQTWMATLAKANSQDLEGQFQRLVAQADRALPDYHLLRSPEVGLAMVRGRAGGTGQQFNLGEMTLTRCVVQLSASSLATPEPDRDTSTSITGFGYVAGRSARHAELAAVCDALLQQPDWYAAVQQHIVQPLQAIAQERQAKQERQTESTRVNFFTLLRGE